VWGTDDYRKQYVGVLGSATAQQVIRKNSEAWQSFFAAREDGEDTAPPSYWGNEDEGRQLRTYIRNDQYTLETGERSRLEIPVGQDLKDEYGLGYHDRLRLEVAGDPKWDGEQGRLELYYDEVSDTFRAFQPVTVPDSRQDSPLAEESAALAIGANNLVPPRPANSTSTRDVNCSLISEKPPRRLPACSPNFARGGTAVAGFSACTASGRDDATTHRTRLCAT